MSSAEDYLPILLQAGVALGFVVMVLVVAPMLGPKLLGKKKNANWECGIEEVGNARFPISIRYLLTAILFVLFDVEVIFFYPYAVNFRELGWDGFWAVLMFVGFFFAGFTYIIKKGALKWK